MELEGLSSDEISDESPCFVVPDSQASQGASERNPGKSDAVNLKGLTLLEPSNSNKSLRQTGMDFYGDGSHTDSDVLPDSSSSEYHSHDTSSLTSKDSSGDQQEAKKNHALYLTRSERAQSKTEENNVKETSSSSISISPSQDISVFESLEEDTDKSETTQDQIKTTGDTNVDAIHSNQERSQQDTSCELQEQTSTGAFECLQFSGEGSGSNDDVILPSSECLRPDSPTQIGEMSSVAIIHKNSDEKQSTMMADNKRTGSTLPLWQQAMIKQDGASPEIATLSSTSSSVSTNSSREISTEESSLHQWQSPENDSDCDMYASDHQENVLPQVNNQHGSFQQHNFKRLSPLELSQDIFQSKPKVAIPEHSSDKQETSPTDEVILPSQDEQFCLYLSQSQSSTSQTRPQLDKPTSLAAVKTQNAGNQEKNVVNLVNLSGQEGNTGSNKTPPSVAEGNTIIPPTPIGGPSSTGRQDIAEDQGQTTCDSPEFTREIIGDGDGDGEGDGEGVSKLNESSESVESGLVGFHFSPPAMLLKPVPRTSPPCLGTSSETIQDPPTEIISAAEFRPISPDLITTSSDLVTAVSRPSVPTLSLSVPVPCEENSDEQGFNLQKDILDDDRTTPIPPSAAKYDFTNVREKYQPTNPSFSDGEVDPFEFRGEICSSLLSKRKRKSRDENRPGNKKRRSQDIGGINRWEDVRVLENDSTSSQESSLKERFWKIVKTKINTTITTFIETQTEIIYTAMDGVIISRKSNVECGDPKQKTTTKWKETREEVDEIPNQIIFDNFENTSKSRNGNKSVQRRHVEESNNILTTDVPQSVQGKAVPTTSRDTQNTNVGVGVKNKVVNVSDNTESSESTSGQHEQCDLGNSKVVQPTKDKDIPYNTVNEPSKNTLTPSTISPPLFLPPSDSASSTNLDDLVITFSTKEKTAVQPKKQTTNDTTSLTKRKRQRSVVNPRTSRSSTSQRFPRVLCEGTRVFALWYDKQYYPGRVISKCNDDVRYRVEFDDGNKRDIQQECIIVVDCLPCDQPVMFCEKTGGVYCEGVIRGFYKNGGDTRYKVLNENKKIVRCPRSNLMLSAEQTAIFLSLRDSTPSDVGSWESLDKSFSDDERRERVVKRARRSHEKGTEKSDEKESPSGLRKSSDQRTKKSGSSLKDARVEQLVDRDIDTKQKTQEKRKEKKIVKVLPEKDGTSAKRPGNAKKGNKVSSNSSTKKHQEECHSSIKTVRETLVKHRNSNADETPKSNRKSTGKKSTGNNLNNDGSINVIVRARRRLSTAMNSCHENTRPIPTRTSPRKHNSRPVAQKNLILPTNKDLFRGYGFLLTGSDVTSSVSENSPGEEEEVYIRDDVIAQIKAGGGEVLKKFLKDYPRDSCFLLSNACQRTGKYFNALVLGVPCLSHAWVRDCCVENRLISFQNYMLPAGSDLITEQLVEKQSYSEALRGLKVHLVGEDGFKEQWNEVLTAAGCEIIQKLPTNVLQKLQHGDDELVCDVIVVGSDHVAHSTIQKARLLDIPTATIHWVKQCILTGIRVDFNAHQSFIYRV